MPRPSIYRRATTDVMRIARQVPMVPAQRRMALGALVTARDAASPKPSWAAIFAKAYALAAAEMPVLRRGYFRYPLPHHHEFESSAAAIAVERDIDGESVVCPLIVQNPAALPIASLTQQIRRAKTADLTTAPEYAVLRNVVRLPWPLRPLALRLGYQTPYLRKLTYGTFGVTAVDGSELLNLVSPLPTVVTYGAPGKDGALEVRLMFDHRLMDAAPVARALRRLEEILNGPILDEIAKRRPGVTRRRKTKK